MEFNFLKKDFPWIDKLRTVIYTGRPLFPEGILKMAIISNEVLSPKALKKEIEEAKKELAVKLLEKKRPLVLNSINLWIAQASKEVYLYFFLDAETLEVEKKEDRIQFKLPRCIRKEIKGRTPSAIHLPL